MGINYGGAPMIVVTRRPIFYTRRCVCERVRVHAFTDCAHSCIFSCHYKALLFSTWPPTVAICNITSTTAAVSLGRALKNATKKHSKCFPSRVCVFWGVFFWFRFLFFHSIRMNCLKWSVWQMSGPVYRSVWCNLVVSGGCGDISAMHFLSNKQLCPPQCCEKHLMVQTSLLFRVQAALISQLLLTVEPWCNVEANSFVPLWGGILKLYTFTHHCVRLIGSTCTRTRSRDLWRMASM